MKNFNCRGNISVATTGVFLLFVIVSSVMFSVWVQDYSSQLHSDIEDTNIDLNFNVERFYEGNLYLRVAGEGSSLEIKELLIGENECSVDSKLESGLNSIDLEDCIVENRITGRKDLIVNVEGVVREDTLVADDLNFDDILIEEFSLKYDDLIKDKVKVEKFESNYHLDDLLCQIQLDDKNFTQNCSNILDKELYFDQNLFQESDDIDFTLHVEHNAGDTFDITSGRKDKLLTWTKYPEGEIDVDVDYFSINEDNLFYETVEIKNIEFNSDYEKSELNCDLKVNGENIVSQESCLEFEGNSYNYPNSLSEADEVDVEFNVEHELKDKEYLEVDGDSYQSYLIHSIYAEPIDASGGEENVYSFDGRDYKIHAFKEVGSNSFNVNTIGATSGEVDVLVVGGGGPGGGDGDTIESDLVLYGAGGGAGGLIYENDYEISSGSIGVEVGGGGELMDNGGEDSEFGGLTAVGGGRGGGDGDPWWEDDGRTWQDNHPGYDGGSGGGGSFNYHDWGQPGEGVSGQGHDGGCGGYRAFGGGGGAGEPGEDALMEGQDPSGAGCGTSVDTESGGTPAPIGGDGGDGKYFGDIFTENYGEDGYFAGGGGGGVREADSGNEEYGLGGLGGGGDSIDEFGPYDEENCIAQGYRADSGMENTGGGGGGEYRGCSGDGGSGIVLVRYPIEPDFDY